MSKRRPRTKRAAMYLAVLMTAAIVAVIGVSAMAAARLQLQAAKGGVDLAQARFCAQSAVEIGLLEIDGDPVWRKTYTNDQWSDEQTLNGGVYAWKLVDDVNGDLLADPNAPVRIYGMGACGDTTRVFSVMFNVASVTKPNLLLNPGMESGQDDWAAAYGNDVDAISNPCHDGAGALRVSDRHSWYQGVMQEITDVVENNVEYEIEAWLRTASNDTSARFFMYVVSTGGTDFPQVNAETVRSSGWSFASAKLTPSWSGSLNQAYLVITVTDDNATFYVDDAVLREAARENQITMLPRTWRRDVAETAAVTANLKAGKINGGGK